MSVTFWMPQAPVVRVQPYPAEEPDYWDVVPDDPFLEINMANTNAVDILALLGEPAHTCGMWDRKALVRVHRSAMRLLNTKGITDFLSTPWQDGNFHHAGRSMDYATRRLTEMVTLTKVAIEHDFYVAFG